MTSSTKGKQKGEYKDITKEGLWFCVQCQKWHGKHHGHYNNAMCHRISYGHKPQMVRHGELVERTN